MTQPADLNPGDLAALLCARLCHDLVSPVSAIGAALDVLEDPDAADMHREALKLVRDAAEQGWARLEFTRLAFGAGGSAPGRIDAAELERVTLAMFSTSKSDIVWRVQAIDLEKSVARVLLNLVLLGVEALPRGGVVTVETTATGEKLKVIAEGRRSRLAPDVGPALAGEEPEDGFDARSIQPYYAGLLARQTGGKASASVDGERVEFVAITPPRVPTPPNGSPSPYHRRSGPWAAP